MDEYSISYLLGIIAGVLVGLLVAAVILKVTKKNGRIKSEYDERQELIRGKGIAWGFLTLVICNILYAGTAELKLELPVVPSVAVVIMIFASAAVMVVYFIWHDVYFGLNSVANGRAVKDGQLTLDSINLFCVGLFAIVFLALLVKRLAGEED